MKSVNDTLLQRRSIRRYEREPVSAEAIEFIYNAIRNTPTSYNGQQFSVVDVTDQTLKEHLYEITGQKQIKTCSHFMAFCSDFNKITVGAKAKNVEMPPFTSTVDGLIVGTVDAALAMMGALVAAESYGLGTCCIGYARTADPESMAKALHLPEGVFVVCGLAIGVPREMPDLKPKQPLSLLIHHDHYRDDCLENDLLKYDSDIALYNATRTGTKSDNDWVAHIISYYKEAMKYNLMEKFRARGYDLKS